jgi:hypothetical protein
MRARTDARLKAQQANKDNGRTDAGEPLSAQVLATPMGNGTFSCAADRLKMASLEQMRLLRCWRDRSRFDWNASNREAPGTLPHSFIRESLTAVANRFLSAIWSKLR